MIFFVVRAILKVQPQSDVEWTNTFVFGSRESSLAAERKRVDGSGNGL